MAFDFAAIKAQKAAIIAQGTPKLIALIAPRGYGKSSIIGTMPKEINTLLCMCTAENHSYASARGIAIKTYGTADHITPFFIDSFDDKQITGDAVVARLIELLTDANTFKYFPAIALDSLAAFDQHVLGCVELLACDKFSSGKIATNIYGRVFTAIKAYVAKGGIFIYTLPAETHPDDKGVMVTTPKLRGSAALNAILGETPLIARIEKLVSVDGDKSTTDYALVFKGGDISKKKSKILSMTGSGKDMVIVSTPITVNYSCRIAGIPTERTPDSMDANLSDLLKLVDNGGMDFTEEGAQ
jgi:hypothetical protein